MTDKFVTIVVDEAMQRICYTGGGWQLTPYQFAVSSTNILGDIPLYDDEENITEEAKKFLKEYTTANMNTEMQTGSVWCQLPFSSVTKPEEASNTLTHHVVIPANATTSEEKNIKTIFFIYTPKEGEPFLYAIAIAPQVIVFEPGVTQSFFFNFTVNNQYNTNEVEFVVNYSYPQEISDHNTDLDAHSTLLNQFVSRDGTRTITGTLMYSGDRTYTNQYQLVSKAYVDSLINELKANNGLK